MSTRRLLQVVQVICLLFIAVVTAGLMTCYVQGGRALSVQTDSMAPAFRPGDGVLVRRVAYGSLQKGDIVSFHSASDKAVILSHRIIRLNPHDESFVTQGDNVSQADQPVRPGQVIGRVVAVAPGYGRFVGLLRQPVGMTCLVYVPAVIIVALEGAQLHRRWQQRTKYSVYKNIRSTQT
jgi:signal peptidase I